MSNTEEQAKELKEELNCIFSHQFWAGFLYDYVRADEAATEIVRAIKLINSQPLNLDVKEEEPTIKTDNGKVIETLIKEIDELKQANNVLKECNKDLVRELGSIKIELDELKRRYSSEIEVSSKALEQLQAEKKKVEEFGQYLLENSNFLDGKTLKDYLKDFENIKQ